MPKIKSKAQRRKFAELLVEGKISPETFEEWNRGAGKAKLPERVTPKAKAKAKRKAKPKRKTPTHDHRCQEGEASRAKAALIGSALRLNAGAMEAYSIRQATLADAPKLRALDATCTTR